jgi:hypothetical protein
MDRQGAISVRTVVSLESGAFIYVTPIARVIAVICIGSDCQVCG